MKNNERIINYKNKSYSLEFNLNVMQEIQNKYGSIDKWAELSEGKDGEPNAEAVIYGFTAMINEGIDIANEERDAEHQEKPLTVKQVGRIITEVGMEKALLQMQNKVIDSVKTDVKNA